MAKVKISDMIIEWLQTHSDGETIANHNVQTDCVTHIKSWHDRNVLPSTVEREFRRLRNQESHLLRDSGLELTDQEMKYGENTWTLKNSL